MHTAHMFGKYKGGGRSRIHRPCIGLCDFHHIDDIAQIVFSYLIMVPFGALILAWTLFNQLD